MSNVSESTDERLRAISDQLKRGVVPPPETVRSLLLWFNANRRGQRITRTVKETLSRHGLTTDPDFEWAYIDDPIRFLANDASDGIAPAGVAMIDPTYRIGRLESANRKPMSVAPDDPLERAVTLLMAHSFSQVPAMTGEKVVKGVVSWKSIGSRLALGQECRFVRDCMEPPCILGVDDSLFEAVSAIAKSDYVLVQAVDKRITGIITATDFTLQFHNLAEPFLLVGEIENGLRQMLHGKFTVAELAAARASGDSGTAINSVNDLTFGEYQRIFESPANWSRLGLEIDRQYFVKQLGEVREIRNDVMHFEPEGLDESDLRLLREFAQFLNRIRDLTVL